MSNEPKPIKELAFILGTFGWDTKFSDLSEDQVHVLIFALQEANAWQEISRERFSAGENDSADYSFITLKRV